MCVYIYTHSYGIRVYINTHIQKISYMCLFHVFNCITTFFFSFQIKSFNLAVVKKLTKSEKNPQNKLGRSYTI